MGWPFQDTLGRSSADLICEPVPGRLPGHAESHGDPVPAPPAGTRGRYPLGDQSLVAADLVGGLGDRAQVGQILHLRGGRVELAGQPLKAAGGILDLSVRVSHDLTAG